MNYGSALCPKQTYIRFVNYICYFYGLNTGSPQLDTGNNSIASVNFDERGQALANVQSKLLNLVPPASSLHLAFRSTNSIPVDIPMAPGRPLIKQESKKQLLSLTVRNGRIRPKISVPRRKRPLLLQKAPSKKRTIYCTPWRGDWRSKRGAVTLPENHPKRILPSLRQEAVETDERIAELQDIQNDCVNITELAELRKRIKIIDQQLHNRFLKTQPHPPCTFDIEQHLQPVFSAEEYKRYGRQMILPGFGLKSQLKLQNSSVLIVGLGGLGCPAAAYIVGAGVRDVGLMDGDEVEVSNLHRQTLHTTGKLGTKKVESAMRYLNE